MIGISGADLVRVWELGQAKPLWYRGLLLLALARPRLSQAQLYGFTIGQRNTCLFELRKQLLGSTLQAMVKCPQCSEILEFSLNITDVCPIPLAERVKIQTLVFESIELTFRLPDSRDLAAISGNRTLEDARKQLINRCLIKAVQEGIEISAGDFPETIIAALADTITEYDPQSELLLSLSCPDCDRAWSAMFDIVSFLWSEISTQAQHLLSEVDLLARAYGWQEETILAMSPKRRQYYLGKVS